LSGHRFQYPPGGWAASEPESEVLRVLRPSDGSLVGELAVTPAHEIPQRVERARLVQNGWASLGPRDRGRRLGRLLAGLEARSEEIVDTITAETGKPRTEALLEMVTVVDHLRWFRRKTPGFFRPRRISTGWIAWKKARLERDPMGVVGVISPWNYPFLLSMVPSLTSLFSGNAVVLKPSEWTPYSGLLVEELARDAGLPEGLVQVVIGGGVTGEALIRSGVDKVLFTGGPGTGRRVMSVAAETLTPVVLELGGKDAAIVLEDADLERAVRGVAWGGLQNAGQTCMAVERIFVVEAIYDAFVRKLVPTVRALRVGSDPGVDIGPMTTPFQLEAVEEQLRDALARGATALTGGGRTDPASNVLEPTVLTGLVHGSSVLEEETFGPVLPVVCVKDAEEAVRRANEGSFGLSASVWTRDLTRGLAVARRVRAGGVCVNDVLTHYAVPGLPFGGSGESGFGRIKGYEGLMELTRPRGVVTDRFGFGREPWWFPYSRSSERLFRAALVARCKGGFRGLVLGLLKFMKGTRRR